MTIEKKIYLDAVEKPEEVRPRFVEAVCGDAGELRESVEAMMTTHEELTGSCDGQTISLVLDSHQRNLLAERGQKVIPPAQNLGKPE